MARPVGGILGCHRARFRRVFAAVGILKMPSATLLRENHGRRTPFYISTAVPQEMNSLRSKMSLNFSQAVLSYGRPRPLGGIFGVHRARFCGVFAPVGIFKMPSATLSRENHGRRTPFHISTGRASRNVQPPLHNVFGFSVDAIFRYAV